MINIYIPYMMGYWRAIVWYCLQPEIIDER